MKNNRLYLGLFAAAIILLFITTCTPVEELSYSSQSQDTEGLKIPYYFIAIHNEPFNVPGGINMLERSYTTLEQMVEKANGYNIKLTLMFTPQWADYISDSSERLEKLELWKQQGHEIAAHHHSIYHGNWDGYTDYTQKEAIQQRIKTGKEPENYYGTLEDFIIELSRINPDINCGCLNDEGDKRALPDEIIYDTCSGFANFGEPGRRLSDNTDPLKGKNEYITVATYNNITRKWLTHYQITTFERQEGAQTVFDSMDFGAYGSVTHSIEKQSFPYYAFLEFLNSKDPDAVKSKTVSQIIEGKLLPEQVIPDAVVNSGIPR